MKFKIISLILVVFLFTGCSSSVFIADSTNATKEDVLTTIDSINQFGIDMYLKHKDDGNVFISPYSISTALAMTYEGAKGETAEEIRNVFGFLEEKNKRGSSYAAIYNAINGEHEEYNLYTANALWLEETYKLLPEYTQTVSQFYDGQVTNVDFVNNPVASLNKINLWVEEKTNTKIKDILGEEDVTSNTRLILTNAIYFKSEWLKRFGSGNTTKKLFYVTPENRIEADTMYIKDSFEYGENEKLQTIRLPYKGEELYMQIYLPKENNISIIEDELKNIDSWDDLLHEEPEVKVYLPKFKFETKYELVQTLSELGMPLAFTNKADFSGMNGEPELFIGNVIHQAFVELDEKGTEAAASTVVTIGLTSIGPGEENPTPIFRADHPFIFTIEDVETGTILFMGKVNEPIQE